MAGGSGDAADGLAWPEQSKAAASTTPREKGVNPVAYAEAQPAPEAPALLTPLARLLPPPKREMILRRMWRRLKRSEDLSPKKFGPALFLLIFSLAFASWFRLLSVASNREMILRRMWRRLKRSEDLSPKKFGPALFLLIFSLAFASWFRLLSVASNREMILRRMWRRLKRSEDLSPKKFGPALFLLIFSLAFAITFHLLEKGVHRVEGGEDKCSPGFWKSLYFIGTIYTTIGYGNVGPCTEGGKALSCICAVIGIPLAVLVLDNLGQVLAALATLVWKELDCFCCCIGILYRRHTRRKLEAAWRRGALGKDLEAQDDDLRPRPKGFKGFVSGMKASDQVAVAPRQEKMRNFKKANARSLNLPVWIGLVICVAWIMLASAFFMHTEDWTLTNSVYFMMISVTTVGFGDVAPTTFTWMVIPQMGFLIIGLSLFSMCINLVEISMDQLTERLINSIALEYKRKLEMLVDKGVEAAGEAPREMTAQEAEKEVEKMLRSEAPIARYFMGKKARRELLLRYGRFSRMRVAKTQTEPGMTDVAVQTENAKRLNRGSQTVEKELKLNSRGWFVKGMPGVVNRDASPRKHRSRSRKSRSKSRSKSHSPTKKSRKSRSRSKSKKSRSRSKRKKSRSKSKKRSKSEGGSKGGKKSKKSKRRARSASAAFDLTRKVSSKLVALGGLFDKVLKDKVLRKGDQKQQAGGTLDSEKGASDETKSRKSDGSGETGRKGSSGSSGSASGTFRRKAAGKRGASLEEGSLDAQGNRRLPRSYYVPGVAGAIERTPTDQREVPVAAKTTASHFLKSAKPATLSAAGFEEVAIREEKKRLRTARKLERKRAQSVPPSSSNENPESISWRAGPRISTAKPLPPIGPPKPPGPSRPPAPAFAGVKPPKSAKTDSTPGTSDTGNKSDKLKRTQSVPKNYDRNAVPDKTAREKMHENRTKLKKAKSSGDVEGEAASKRTKKKRKKDKEAAVEAADVTTKRGSVTEPLPSPETDLSSEHTSSTQRVQSPPP